MSSGFFFIAICLVFAELLIIMILVKLFFMTLSSDKVSQFANIRC